MYRTEPACCLLFSAFLNTMPSKTPTVCNWVPSTVNEERLKEFFSIGFLPGKNVMSYRAPDSDEERPNPRDGEVIVFTDHMNRGFSPPGSKFLRDLLHFFNSTLKISGPIPYLISATSKCSLKCTSRKSQPWNCLENIFI